MSQMCQQRTYAAQQITSSIDNLIGELLQIDGYVEPENLGRIEVDDELEFRGLLDRQVTRPLALENSPNVDADVPIAVGDVHPVAHQTTGGGKLACKENGGHPLTQRQRCDLTAPAKGEWVRADDKPARSHLRQSRECSIDAGRAARLCNVDLQSEGAAGSKRVPRGRLGKGFGRIDKHGDKGRLRHHLMQHLDLLLHQFDAEIAYAGDVAARSVQARD